MKNNKVLKSGAFLLVGAITTLSVGFTLGRISGEITPESISSAADLIGLEFSPAEKDSMVNTLKNQLSNIREAREFQLDNSVAPSLIFNPLPKGYQPDQDQRELDWGLASQLQLPEREADIAYLPVHDLAVLIQTKKSVAKD